MNYINTLQKRKEANAVGKLFEIMSVYRGNYETEEKFQRHIGFIVTALCLNGYDCKVTQVDPEIINIEYALCGGDIGVELIFTEYALCERDIGAELKFTEDKENEQHE